MAFFSLGQMADLMTVVASTAVTFGIVFAWFEYRGRKSEYERQVEDSRIVLLTGMTKYLNEVARVFVEYPEMKRYFHDGDKPSDAEDVARAEAIAITLANAMDHVLLHLDRVDTAERGAWEAYFDHVYKHSPTLRTYLGEHADWYGPRVRERLIDGNVEPDPSP